MKQFDEKIYKNALLASRLTRLDKNEKQRLVLKLLNGKTERELGEELGIPHSTIHDWKTLRQDNAGEMLHVSLAMITRKLKTFKPETLTDYMFLESIKKIVTEKLKR